MEAQATTCYLPVEVIANMAPRNVTEQSFQEHYLYESEFYLQKMSDPMSNVKYFQCPSDS